MKIKKTEYYNSTSKNSGYKSEYHQVWYFKFENPNWKSIKVRKRDVVLKSASNTNGKTKSRNLILWKLERGNWNIKSRNWEVKIEDFKI